MPLPVPEKERTLAQLNEVTGRFTRLLRTADPKATAIGYWSVAELASHVSQVYTIYVDLIAGGSSPIENHREIAAANDRIVNSDPERDLIALADRIEKAHAAFVEGLADIGWTDTVNWHGGLKVPVHALPGVLVQETEVHGLDISKTTSTEWDIPRANAALAIETLYYVMPDYLRADMAQKYDAIWAVSLRGASTTYFQLSGSRLNITTDKPGSVDCRISADPVAYLLVGYGRASQWPAILTGKIVTYGRKPWLGLAFAKLFESV